MLPLQKKKKKKTENNSGENIQGNLEEHGAQEGTLSEDSTVIMVELSVVTGVKCLHKGHS